MTERDEKAAELAALCETMAEDHWMEEKPESESGYGFHEVHESGAGGRRWLEAMTTVIKSERTGRFWQYEWERGLTERQENEYPNFEDPKTFTEVVPFTRAVTKTVTTYVAKEKVVGDEACGSMDST